MHPRIVLTALALALLLYLPVSAAQYWVGSRGGRIVAYRVNDPQPCYVSGQIVPHLPRADRQRLARGLTVEGEAALRRLLEDYTA